MTVYTYVGKIEIVDCADCGKPFGLTADFIQRRRDDGKTFYCPSGCWNYYSDSNIDRLKRRVKTLEREEEELRERVRMQKKETAAAKGQATKAKNRAKRGVCLYCNRTVKQMAKHVADKHTEEVTG